MIITKTLEYFGVVSFIIPAQYMLEHTLFLQAAKALVSLCICTDSHGPKLLDNVMNTCACPCVSAGLNIILVCIQ